MTANMKAKFFPNEIFYIDNPIQRFNEVVFDATTNPRTCILFVRHKYTTIFIRAELGFHAAPVNRIIEVGTVNRTTNGISSQIVQAIKDHKDLAV